MQNSLKEARADSFEKLLQRLPIGIERIDTEGKILYSNPARDLMIGYSAGELVGRDIFDFAADAEYATRLKNHLEYLVEHQPEPEPWIGSNRRKDGTVFDLRVDWQYDRDERGNLVGFIAAISDISAQREAERGRDRNLEALQTNRRHLASLMDSAVHFVLYRLAAVPDKPYSGEVVLVSPSIRDVMGVEDPEDFSTWFANIHPEDRDRVVAANQESSQSGRPFDEEMRIHHPGKGEVRWIRAISRPIMDEHGTPLFFNGLIIDITNERRAQEDKRRFELKLQQTQRLESLGTLAGGIAHDFNNLLVGILGNSDLALESLEKGSPARKLVENIVTAAQSAADLTNQLLAYSGRGSFNVRVTNLNDILKDMVSILKPAISKTAKLDLDLAVDLPDIQVDISQVNQVIMNLITNASDALANEPGSIRLSTSEVEADDDLLAEYGLPQSFQGGRYVRFAAEDTGCGMDAGTLARIYDPFFTSKGSGRGLGLAAVRGIIHGHQGEIHVSSAPGRGTTFTVFLPVAVRDKPRRRDDTEDVTTGAQRSRTVLVVDDEDLVRQVAAKMLEVNGHKVLTATNGKEGLAVYTANADEIDAVLLDVNMPEMSGHDTFRALRQLRHDLPVVFSTGYAERETMHLLKAETAVDFVQKPYRVAKLLEKLRTVGA